MTKKQWLITGTLSMVFFLFIFLMRTRSGDSYSEALKVSVLYGFLVLFLMLIFYMPQKISGNIKTPISFTANPLGWLNITLLLVTLTRNIFFQKQKDQDVKISKLTQSPLVVWFNVTLLSATLGLVLYVLIFILPFYISVAVVFFFIALILYIKFR